GDAASGAQLAQRQGEVAGGVGGDRKGLAHHGDTAGAAGRRQRMLVRALRLLIDQLRGHRQMTSRLLGVLLAERLQFIACGSGKITSGDLIRQRRLRDVLADGRELIDRAIDAAARPVPERLTLTGLTAILAAVPVGAALTRLGAVTTVRTVALRTVAIPIG